MTSIPVGSSTTFPHVPRELAECSWCGSMHTGICPKVLSIEYHPNGSIKRVEFK